MSHALWDALAGHSVEVVCDPVDAIHRIDCAASSHDVIFCDLECDKLSGPELWAFLAQRRTHAAGRVVFVASSVPSKGTLAFLARVPNLWLRLPVDTQFVRTLVELRASGTLQTFDDAEVTRLRRIATWH